MDKERQIYQMLEKNLSSIEDGVISVAKKLGKDIKKKGTVKSGSVSKEHQKYQMLDSKLSAIAEGLKEIDIPASKDGYTPQPDIDYPSISTIEAKIKAITPKKGADYFTKKEIKEITQEVLSSIVVPGVDYKKLEDFIKAEVSKIPRPESTVINTVQEIDINSIISEVLSKIPGQKDIAVDYESIEEYCRKKIEEIERSRPRQLNSAGPTTRLEEMNDVSTEGITIGQVLAWNGQGWSPVNNSGGGGGTVDSVVAGNGISVDSTDPANPIVSFIDAEISEVNGLQDILDSLVEAGEYIFFFEDEADGVVSGYKVMDNPAQVETEAEVTQSTVSDGALIQSWITDVGLPNATFIPDGVWTIHLKAYKTGGTKETRIYNELYKRDLAGTETLLGTTANSIALTGVATVLPTFNIAIAGQTLLDTDRIVTKTRIRLVGGGSDPTSVTIAYSGSTASRLSIPVQAVDVTQFVRISGNQTVDGIKTFTSSPIVPTPTTDFQASTKKYADDGIAGLSTVYQPLATVLTNTTASFTTAQETKLAGIETGAEVNNISDANATDLTDGGETTLHIHDGRYYTESEVDSLLSGKQNSLGFTPENVANKENTTIDTNTTKYPTINLLKTGLDTKVTGNTAITGATKTKVTYDAKGLVTAGADATTADIADSSNRRYVTDAQLVVIGNTSNTNTGDQTITLTGDVTGSGTGSFATTIANGVVGIAKLSATGTPSASTYLRGDNTWATIAGGGTVTSVGVSVPIGLTVSGTPVTTSGTIALALDTGYVIPLQSTIDAKAPLASPTFTGTVTTPALNISGATASQILGTDASKNVVSLSTATYPSLTELTYVKGVTSAIQTQLNAKQATITGGATTIATSNLTVSRALASDGSGKVAVSATTAIELGYVSGVTSAIQTQLNAKISSISGLDHNSLGNLTTGDVHTQYVRNNGRAGGQTVAGGLSGTGNLLLTSNGSGSKTAIVFGTNSIFQETTERWGFGNSAPDFPVHVGAFNNVSSGLTDAFIVAGFTDSTLATGKAEIFTQGDQGGAFSIYKNDGLIASSIYQDTTDTAVHYLNEIGGSHLFDSSSGELARLTGSGLSIGTTAQDAKLQVSATTQQFKINYNGSNHGVFSIGSSGNYTVALTGTSPRTFFSQDVLVPDEAYGVGWDTSLEVPTKNAVYDKVETVVSTIPVYVGSAGDSITSTTLVNINGLTLALIAGTYIYECHMNVSSTTAAGARFAVAYTGTTTTFSGSQLAQAANTTWVATGHIATIGTEDATTSTTGATENKIILTGKIVVSTSGNLTIQGRKITSGTLTVRSSAWLKAVKIA